jgi:hypothetical protein
LESVGSILSSRGMFDGTCHPPDGNIASALDVSLTKTTFCVTSTGSPASAVLSCSATWPSCPSLNIDAEAVRLSASVVAAIATVNLRIIFCFLQNFNDFDRELPQRIPVDQNLLNARWLQVSTRTGSLFALPENFCSRPSKPGPGSQATILVSQKGRAESPRRPAPRGSTPFSADSFGDLPLV